MSLKKGDKVKLLGTKRVARTWDECVGLTKCKVGDVFEIDNITHFDNTVRLTIKDYANYFKTTDLELINYQTDNKAEYSLKVGDTVKLLGTKTEGCNWESHCTHSGHSIGDIVTIERACNNYVVIKENHFSFGDIVKVSSTTPNFKAGDAIRLLGTKSASHSTAWEEFTKATGHQTGDTFFIDLIDGDEDIAIIAKNKSRYYFKPRDIAKVISSEKFNREYKAEHIKPEVVNMSEEIKKPSTDFEKNALAEAKNKVIEVEVAVRAAAYAEGLRTFIAHTKRANDEQAAADDIAKKFSITPAEIKKLL